jgi:hypothetical protein
MRRLNMIECGYIWRAGGLRLRCGLLLWVIGLHSLALRSAGEPQVEAAKKVGISERQGRRVEKAPDTNTTIDWKVSGPRPAYYQMKAGTQPATAAARIREKFGDAFASTSGFATSTSSTAG